MAEATAPALSRRAEQRLFEEMVLCGRDVARQGRLEEVETAGVFGSTYTDADETHSYASWIPAAAATQQQLELDLPVYSERAAIRLALAERIELAMRRTGWGPRWAEGIPNRLRHARQSGCVGIERDTGRRIVYWDNKAGYARLCPDDAREESMRVSRHYLPELVRLQAAGHRLTSAVFTTPNAAPGKLRAEMASIFRAFRRLLKKFPQIKGALCVLEAPLGRARDWNVHLNVILVTKGGIMDWAQLRKAWHWNVHLQLLPVGENAIRGALSELIKYAVAATVAKSAEKAARHEHQANRESLELSDRLHATNSRGSADPAGPGPREPVGCGEAAMADAAAGGSGLDSDALCPLRGETRGTRHAPPMLAWTDPELIEWLEAMHGFRRTRSYGALYALEAPELEQLGPMVWIGTVGLERGRYVYRSPLLDSIPEDKSLTPDPLVRWKMFVRRVLPREPSGLEGLEGRLPRLAELG